MIAQGQAADLPNDFQSRDSDVQNEDREDNRMSGFKPFVLAAVAAICLALSAPKTHAQLQVDIGVAPVCPYGYYDVPPYDCAPYGYYGPEWFTGGVFIGAGPWFHGHDGFRGYVNNPVPS
jgi:hypothetical protein